MFFKLEKPILAKTDADEGLRELNNPSEANTQFFSGQKILVTVIGILFAIKQLRLALNQKLLG